MTNEETAKIVMSEVVKHWALKVLEIPFEKILDPVKVVRTVENLYDPLPSTPSDYMCSIERSYDKMVQAGKGKPMVNAEKGKPVVQA